MMHLNLSINRESWAKIGFFVSVFSTLGLFLLVYLNLDKGYNFSDEGMYLYSIVYPERPWSLLSDFGAFLNPFFELLGRDLYSFRLWTFIALLLFAKILIISFLLLFKRHTKLSFWHWGSLSFAMWSCTLGYYTYWLPTASYNTLALIGIFGVLSALNFYTLLCRPYGANKILAKERTNNILKNLVIFLIACFGVVAFIGKATTGAGMGVIAAVWIYFSCGTYSRKSRLIDIAVAGVLAIIVLALYLFLMSNGIDTFRKLMLCAELLDNSYGLDKTLMFYAHYIVPISYVLVLVTWPLWGIDVWLLHKEKYNIAAMIAGLCAIIFLVTSYIWLANYIAALMVWPLGVAVFAGACLWRVSWKHVCMGVRLSLIFFLTAMAYHAGTNTPFEYKVSEALILPALGIVAVAMSMQPMRRSIVVPGLSILLCCIALGSLLYSIFEPTRHNGKALWELTEPMELTPNTRPIFVHPERKAFIEWLDATAKENGWQEGTPIINTSYYTSGSLYLLGGYKMEGNWQIQARYTPKENYPIIFSQAPAEDLHKAWIIRPTNDGPRHMPTAILQELGLPFPQGYEKIGVSTPEASSGIWPAEQYEIWKPKQK